MERGESRSLPTDHLSPGGSPLGKLSVTTNPTLPRARGRGRAPSGRDQKRLRGVASSGVSDGRRNSIAAHNDSQPSGRPVRVRDPLDPSLSGRRLPRNDPTTRANGSSCVERPVFSRRAARVLSHPGRPATPWRRTSRNGARSLRSRNRGHSHTRPTRLRDMTGR